MKNTEKIECYYVEDGQWVKRLVEIDDSKKSQDFKLVDAGEDNFILTHFFTDEKGEDLEISLVR